MLIYRTLADDTTKVGHIVPEAMLDIIGISDPKLRADYIKSFEALDKLLVDELGGEVSYIDFKAMAKKTMMNFEVDFEAGMELDDVIDDFQEKLEAAFVTKGYIIAGFYNMKDSLNSQEDAMPEYTAYVVWSLCHIPFSYTIFDGKNPLPQAAIFAPCSMYAYIKEGENKIVIGMPTLGAWAAALGITDKDKLKKIKQLDTEIPAIIHSLGGVDTDNQNPLLRK
jgi:uncharacterized protein (DUF302 family)